jgi:hypothetical protein
MRPISTPLLFLTACSIFVASNLPASAVTVTAPITPGSVKLSATVDSNSECIVAGTTAAGCSSVPLGFTDLFAEAKPDSGLSEAGAQAFVSNDPSVEITAELSGNFNVVASATETYYVKVIGPTGQPATLDILGKVTVSDMATGPITAGFAGYTFVGPGANAGNGVFINGSAPATTSLDGTLSAQGQGLYALTLSANVTLNLGIPTCCVVTPGVVSAGVDPILAIDPDMPDADAFSLQFSTGFGPAGSAVPEPSTWAMMLLGFAGLGYVGYRTSRKAVSIAA